MNRTLIILFSLLMALSACLPTSPKSNRKSTSSASSGASPTPGPANPPSTFGGSKYWYSGSQSVSGTMTINEDIQTVVYLRGSEIHNYLISETSVSSGRYNYQNTYCVIANITIDSIQKHLRARAVPIDFYNFTAKSKERLFRIDLPSVDDNSSTCGGPALYYDNNGVPGGNPTEIKFLPSKVCETCNSKIPSDYIQIYESSGGLLAPTPVDASKLTLAGLGLQIDTTNSSSDLGNQCSISSCQAKGFDCCLDGQCVNDGGMRNDASSHPLFNQAMNDVAENSMNFINYPDIFFVCTNVPRPTPTPTPTTNPNEGAEAVFQRELKEYYCLEEGKKDIPDFAEGECKITPKKAETYFQDIKYYFKTDGTQGNGYQIEYVGGGSQGNEVITENSVFKLQIKIESGVSRATDVITALNNYVGLGNFLQVNYILVGLDTSVQSVGAASPLQGGADPNEDTSLNKTYCEQNGGFWKFHCVIGSCSNALHHSKFDCEANGDTWTTVYSNAENQNGTQQAHNSVRADVWDRCGCEADPFPSDPDEPQCPDYGLKAVKDSNGTITDILCLVPNANAEPTPFQNLSTSVPSRSAPHRFFSNDGTNYDDLSELQGQTNISQEGEAFSYTDEGGKTGPIRTEFAMNSIIGQMALELNRALPAKMIGVEFDQTYVISAVSGYYTPCPTCANDQWFEAFKPFPPSQKGNGLSAIGFITNRSSYSNNLSLGNYEDTIFGRACWVPPTMLPWSHFPDTDLQKQRQNRLEAQSAMWVNGYQRDWYGFNKGALIGSFDGVSWFAIGDGRRITATSNKLFLAINAPFADLAEPTDLTVSIVQDLGQNTVTDYDYDPELGMDHPEQNHAATCQNFHKCEVDVDCITTLGWEYTCADVLEYRSNWPKFDIEGNEIVDKQRDSLMWSQILNGLNLTSNTKKCVYRGAGAPCMRDWSGESTAKQKHFRCAPNFYCADLGRADFNKEVARTPNLIEVILFGQDADVLGRPLGYLGANASLSSETRDALNANSATMKTSGGQMGLCRPGKALTDITTANPITKQHIGNDPGGRTDYISQISSCNSATIGLPRTGSCPVVDMDRNSDSFGNLIYTENQIGGASSGPIGTNAAEALSYKTIASQQNMCGGESQYMESGELVSSFKEIEAENLSSLSNLLFPKVPRDACLRRAGQVCHTDLDCGPNRLHSDQALFLGKNKFGNTDAEHKFWQEGLICSQSASVPQLNTDAFGSYDMTVNRCSREIGKDITMFTQYSRSDGSNIQSTDPKLVETIFNGNEDLRTIFTPTATTPSENGRYSRYTSFAITDAPVIARNAAPFYQAPLIEVDTSGVDKIPESPKAFQWKTINDTGRNTCSGNGWVRKFSDGTNDWSNRQRLNFDYTNLECLNYRTPLPFGKPQGINSNNYQKDVDKLCLSPGEFGCAQYPLDRQEISIAYGTAANPYMTYEETSYTIRRPSDLSFNNSIGVLGVGAGVLETFPANDPSSGTLEQRKNHHSIYQPVPYNTPTKPPDGNWNFMASQTFNYGASFFLPSYIQKDNILEVHIVYFKDGSRVSTARTEHGDCNNNGVSGAGPGGNCVIELGGNCSLNCPTCHTKRKCLNSGGTWNPLPANCNITSWAAPDIKNITKTQARPNEVPGLGNGEDEAAFCIANEGNYDVFHFGGRQSIDPGVEENWQYGGVRIIYNPINTQKFEVCHSGAPNYTILDETRESCPGTWEALENIPDSNEPRVMNPGNVNYYTTKLARLELLGIPQIFYEPIYCTHDRTQVVPGIFEAGLGTREDWEDDAKTFPYNIVGNSDLNSSSIYDTRCGGAGCSDSVMNNYTSGNLNRAVLKDKVKMADIFSENEFKCCRETNLETDSGSNCCSGTAVDVNGVLTCKLPPGTDLNVFFNKFVSGEGMSEYIEENSRLSDTDFVPETGEPKLSTEVEQKLVNLGALFCASGTVRAGATDGFFYAEPNNEVYYHQTQVDEETTKYRSLIDTNLDFDSDNDTGSFRFNEGFRWSHHIYCQ